ncbi:MAG: hypothetical protein R3D98_14605 [Candidatus Krumholzibacteriia bacterium]
MPILTRFPSLAPVVLAMTLVASAAPAAGLSMDPDQRDGYRVWLHNLEAGVAARQERGVAEVVARFPFGLLADERAGLADTLSLRVVARELGELESRPRLLQEPAERTALHAVTRARNYRNIAEYDSALAWYGEALRRDRDAAFAEELVPETMATAAAAGDSAVFAGRLADVLDAGRPYDHLVELRLAHRFFLAEDDTLGLDRLIAALADSAGPLPDDLGYWQALALSRRGRWQESLDRLLDLVGLEGRSLGLAEAQRTWVLVAIPDLLVITGHNDEAAPLYRALAESELPGAREWARCQVAVLDFLDGDYLAAGTTLGELCSQREAFPWRAYACGMSQLSDEMQRLRNEGREHGAASHFER